MTMTRRQFGSRTATAALSLGTLSMLPTTAARAADANGDAAAPMPICDTHEHLWNLEQFKLPWLASAPEVLRKSYLPSNYAAATDGLNVVRSVYMEVDVAPADQQAEAEYVIGLSKSKKTPMKAAVISGRPADKEAFRKYIQPLKETGYIRGVRQVLHAPEAKQGLCLQPDFVASIQYLGELDLSFDLCMRPTELADGAKLVDQCPDTRFILDHCGNGDPLAFLPANAREGQEPTHEVEAWKRDIAALAKRKSVICKISGIVARAPKKWTSDMLAPIVNHCLDEFGPERVVFGGDWPVCLLRSTYRQWVEALREIVASRPAAEQKKLWNDNAQRLYAVK